VRERVALVAIRATVDIAYAPAEPRATWKRSYGADELLRVACPVCGCGAGSDIAHEFGIAIARCRACGVVFTRTPLPGSQRHYGVARSVVEEKYGRILSREADHPRTANYHEHLALLEGLTAGRELLDVGAHCGFFLDVARSRGWRTTGVEPSPVTSALARERFGLEVHRGTLDEVALPAASFHVVTLVDVFEHMPEPRRTLEQIGRLLCFGGRLFIKVPNVRYVLAKYRLLRRSRLVDDAFDAREHLVHYSIATLGRVLRMTGFEIEQASVPRPIDSGASWKRAIRTAGPALARRLPHGVASPLATDLSVVARSWRAADHTSPSP
jgi:2-polyprenyl-3-methyl-5-hydroxy-6-metoxy-1,4-benzoquinol methylase